ncbi:uncharacterized protein LOC141685940 [Apium graveolens]|uniref:uncharacterized protein LOC141685940 n=1 Tax=Apium graveolens TaxID=4045 RepID=UPI003D79142E
MDHAKIVAAVETEKILIHASDPSKKVNIGSGLEASFIEDLVSLLRGYSDIFAWSQFNLSFIPRTVIKAQALADFIIEYNFPEDEPRPMSIDPESSNDNDPGAWALKVDESSTNERSGAGLIQKSPEGFTIETAISFGFVAINNQAEYEALIAGLKLAKTLRIQDLKIYSDSQIIVKQTNGEYIAKDPVLAKYQALVQSYLALIPKTQVLQICREENSEADALSKLVQN